MNAQLLPANLDFFKTVNPALHSALQASIDAVSWDEFDSLFFNQSLVLPSAANSLATKLESQFRKPNRVRVPRIGNNVKPLQLVDLAYDIVDFHGGKLLANLPNLYANSVGSQSPINAPLRDYLILGSLSLAPLLTWLQSQEKPIINSITIVEADPKQLVAVLSRIDFQDVVRICKQHSIGLHLIYEPSTIRLQECLFFHITLQLPLALHGLQVIDSAVSHPVLEEIRGWLFSQSGIGYRFVGTLGSTTDELNQLIQAAWNALAPSPVRWLSSPPSDSPLLRTTAVIVGSGPSLEAELPRLREHRARLTVIAAGSGIGSLMRFGIVPDAAVFLERGSTVFDDLQELIQEGYNFDGIRLFASVTTDPRIKELFSDVYLFQRPSSTAIALFPEGAQSALLHAGPESNNAAVDVALHLGFSRMLLLGCDFGATDRKHPRAKDAVGMTPRVLDEPVRSNQGRTVFSNPSLLASRDVMHASLSHYPNVKVRRIGEGVELLAASDTTWAELLADAWLDGEQPWPQIEAYCHLSHLDQHSLHQIAAEAKSLLPLHTEDLLQALRSEPSHGWSIQLHRLFAPLFAQFPSQVESQAKLLVHRLYREILFHMVAPLVRLGPQSEEWSEVTAEFASSIDYCNRLFCAVLEWTEALDASMVSTHSWNPVDIKSQLSARLK